MVEGDGGGQRTTPSADQECPVPHAHRIGHDDRVQRYMVNGVGPNFEMNQYTLEFDLKWSFDISTRPFSQSNIRPGFIVDGHRTSTLS